MPESATLPRSGLLSLDDAPVPLTGVAIDAEINNLCARVTVTQRFVNRETKPIEAVYLFPLDEGAAVCGFQAIIDGTLVVGEVREREQAFREYDEAMEQGHGGFLLDEERPDVFQASVGNLLPGKEVLLKVTYVTELNVGGGSIRFAIPTTVSPRYAPAEDRVGVGRPDAETLNPPLMWDVPYGLELKIDLSMSGTIGRIESPSHPVSITLNGDKATVALSQRDTALDRDFVLAVNAAALDAPRAWVERDDDGTHAIAVAFTPKLPETTTPAEVIFLVDRSGSMGGSSIEEVRNALQLCLRSMVAGCRFNIIGFGSTTEALFPESRDYNDASLREASAHVSALEANLGGTELLPALKFALEPPVHGSLARQVVVLTDGEVTNTDAVLAVGKKHASQARIFTFGTGAGASHHLVNGLARAGNGAAEFIYPGERIEPKVVRLFGRLLSPALTNVRVDWAGLSVTQAPSAAPIIFPGGRLLVYGFLRTVPPEWTTTAVRITADALTGPVRFETAIERARVVTGRTVATLAARARIRELEESPEWTTGRGSQQRERKVPAVTEEIIALSTRYGLISRETSYVAIERREMPVVENVQLRRVPIALTTGWGGVDSRRMDALRPAVVARRLSIPTDTDFLAAPQLARADFRALASSAPDEDLRSAWSSSQLFDPRPGRRSFITRSAHGSAAARSKSPMLPLVTLQRADGSWELTDDFAAAIARDLQQLESALGADVNVTEVRDAWATALAIAWLHLHASDAEEEWRLLTTKARSWLAAVTTPAPDGLPWLDAAEKFVRTGR